MQEIKKLEKEFIGIGEVSEFTFEQIIESDKAYVYKVNDTHYEVFMKKVQKESDYIMGGQKIHLERKEIYPKSGNFGLWAWEYMTLDNTMIKWDLIHKNA